jgi:hypothetical protein
MAVIAKRSSGRSPHPSRRISRQIRLGLGQVQALRFCVGTLLAIGHHNGSAAKLVGRTETARITNTTGVMAALPWTHLRLQVATGMHSSVEEPYGSQTQHVVQLLKPCQPSLVTLHLPLQLPEILEPAIGAIEREHLLGQGGESLGRVWLVRSGVQKCPRSSRIIALWADLDG